MKKLKESKEYLLFTIQGQEEERGRIARDLHDTVAQNLRYCKSLCETTEAAKNLPQIAAFLSKSLVEVRSMSYNLAPPDITKNDFLLELFRSGHISLQALLETGTFPFADKLLQYVNSEQQQQMQMMAALSQQQAPGSSSPTAQPAQL